MSYSPTIWTYAGDHVCEYSKPRLGRQGVCRSPVSCDGFFRFRHDLQDGRLAGLVGGEPVADSRGYLRGCLHALGVGAESIGYPGIFADSLWLSQSLAALGRYLS